MAEASNPFSVLFEPLSRDPWSPLRDHCKRLTNVKGEEVVISDNTLSDQKTSCDRSGYPMATPLSTLNSVLEWKSGHDDVCVASVPLCPRHVDPFVSPNIIVCHDMMGGYTNDRYVQGCGNGEDYYFYHWQHISTFIYFSHHFVTIPPASWTNAAHRHGVLCLGTIITEWQDGARLCAQLLSNEHLMETFVQQIIAITQYYHFDGWLVNIENPVHPQHVDNLSMMLMLLSTGLHDAIPGSKVIWYDSVTTAGELKWQNKLNEHNESYFNLCDGIFLNYHWTRSDLQQTALVAGSHCSNVFVGIDVFGRGCYGGGGFNTHLALEVIAQNNLSAAIFAPGWVFENNDKSLFFDNQDKFWTLLSPYCPTYPLSNLPLVSSFGHGKGTRVSINGKVVYQGVWSNLSAQDIQLSFTTKLYENDAESSILLKSVKISDSDMFSYNNSSVLNIQGRCTSNGHHPAIIRLFKTDLGSEEPLLISYTFKCSSDNIKHYLRLRTNGDVKFIALDPSCCSDDVLPCSSYGIPFSSSQPLLFHMKKDSYLRLASLPVTCQEILHSLFTDTSSDTTWITKYFVLDMKDGCHGNIIGISICLYKSDTTENSDVFNFTVGEIKLLKLSSVFDCHEVAMVTSLVAKDIVYTSNHLSCILMWSNNKSIDYCNIFYCNSSRDIKFIGRAFVNQFFVVNLSILNNYSVKFYVQAVTISRQQRPLENTPSLVIAINNH